MKYKQNLHTHSIYCDGKDAPEETVKRALELGFNSIGFSGHSPTSYSDAYHFDKSEEYKKEIYRLKEKYRGIIDVYCGLEFDMYSGVDTTGYEYLIGAMHYLKLGEDYVGFDRSAEVVKKVIDEHFGGDGLKFAKEYYAQLSNLSEYGKFDIVGHFDLITKNIENANLFDVNSKEYKKYAIDALNVLAEKFDVFEVNTGAIARGYRTTPYPAPFILKEMKSLGSKLIITSDCHDKNYLDCQFKETEQYVKSYGFNEIYYFDNGQFKPCKI